jgi:PIN domain nuclease of toxin-antitoxin system
MTTHWRDPLAGRTSPSADNRRPVIRQAAYVPRTATASALSPAWLTRCAGLWEVGRKVQIGKLRFPRDLAECFGDALAPNIEPLPLTAAIVTDATGLPELPTRDPADELIVATSRVHELTLLTTDRRLRGYRHPRMHCFSRTKSQT